MLNNYMASLENLLQKQKDLNKRQKSILTLRKRRSSTKTIKVK